MFKVYQMFVHAGAMELGATAINLTIVSLKIIKFSQTARIFQVQTSGHNSNFSFMAQDMSLLLTCSYIVLTRPFGNACFI